MPDVESQLRQYFDSTVERIDADDVMAGARVTTQLQRWNVRAGHPFRVAAAAAALMMAAIGAIVLGAWTLGRGGTFIRDTDPAPTATQPSGTAGWLIALIAAVAVVAGIIALAYRRTKGKGGVMDTMERQSEKPRENGDRPNRGLLVALVVALVALAALGTWVLFDKVVNTGIEADINALLDQYQANANAGNWEANADLLAVQGVFIDAEGDVFQADDYVEFYEDLESKYGKFNVEQLGDPVAIEDAESNRYYVSVPSQFGVGQDPYVKGFSTFVLLQTDDGELLIRTHQWAPYMAYR
jgi:hypothetical protein